MLARPFLFLGLLLFITFSACDSESTDTTANPENLEITVNVFADRSGTVEFTATAKNTTEFHLFAGENPNEDPIIDAMGEFSYTYEASGSYLIEIRAYGSAGTYVKKELEIIVGVGDPVYPDLTLVWSDEFNGSALNTGDWTFEIGNGNSGWGNNELQYYRSENTEVSNGFLTIEARKEVFEGKQYTSSRIITKDKVDLRYGRIDIKAKLPEGQGIWPALWMLGSNIDAVGWPACGEIDIMELVGHVPNEVHGTVHYGPPSPNNLSTGTSFKLNSGKFSDEFHLFSLVWQENLIQWYVDDQLYFTRNPSDLADTWPFNKDFFFIFNVAVGGNWPGSPNGSTVFPQQMVVDYIRVYQPN